MNWKYYLRGLGIGILVTAVVMSVSASGKSEHLSDAEIKERAKALGMTESTVLSKMGAKEEVTEEIIENTDTAGTEGEEGADVSDPGQQAPTETEEGVENQTPAESSAAQNLTESSTNKNPAEAPTATVLTMTPMPTPHPTATVSPSAMPTATPKTAEGPSTSGMGLPAEDVQKVTITVNSGDGSYTVCRRLEEAGLISSASEYDTYLCKNGYDKRMRVGTYNIPAGSDQETIAKIISGK